MKRRARAFILVALSCVILLSSVARAEGLGTPASRLQGCLDALSGIMASPPSAPPQALLQRSSAIVIVPDILKASFFFGARYGKGVMMARGIDGRWGYPVIVSLTGGSFGIQAGIQSTDIVLVYRKVRKDDGEPKKGIILGADASLMAGVTGIQMDENVLANPGVEVYTFSRARGLVIGFSLQGAQIRVDEGETSALYGKGRFKIQDIIAGKVPTPPSEVTRFRDSFVRLVNPSPGP